MPYRGVEKTPPPISLRSRPALEPRAALGLAIKRLRKRADLTQEEAAAAMGVVVQSWRRYEWGERDLPLEKLDAVAAAVGSNREELLEQQRALLHGPHATHVLTAPPGLRDRPMPAQTALTLLPVRDRVQAGAWLAADDFIQDGRTVPVVRDPRYPNAEQWVDVVVGDSLDLRNIFDGDMVHVVEAAAYLPVTGDLVEVERLRFQGAERELSIKEVEVTPTATLLWPRSSNPRWQEPLSLSYGLGDDEEFEVRIRGKVIAAFRRF